MRSSDPQENLNIPPVANKERQVGIPFSRRKLKAVWTEETQRDFEIMYGAGYGHHCNNTKE